MGKKESNRDLGPSDPSSRARSLYYKYHRGQEDEAIGFIETFYHSLRISIIYVI